MWRRRPAWQMPREVKPLDTSLVETLRAVEPVTDTALLRYTRAYPFDTLEELKTVLRRLTYGEMMTFAGGIDSHDAHALADKINRFASK